MKKNNFLCFIFIFIVLLVVFYPVLFGNKVFFQGDVSLDFCVLSSFFEKEISHFGTLNFWSSEIVSGFPTHATMRTFLYPLNIVFYRFLSFVSAYNWIIFLNFFLGALFTYLFVRNLELNKTASLIAAFTYILSSWVVTYGAIVVSSTPYFILPLLFLSLLKISRGRYRYVWIGGLSMGIGCLAGHSQLIVFIGLAALFYTLFLDYLNYDNQKSFFRNFNVAKAFIAICFIGLLIGFPQLLSLAKLSKLGARAEGLDYGMVSKGALSPIYLIDYLFPYFRLPFLSFSPAKLYIGFLSLFFGLVAVFCYPKNKTVWFFIFLYCFGFLSAISYSPLSWLMHYLPVFKYFRAPSRWIYIATFASSILAAHGYYYFLNNPQLCKKLINLFKYVICAIVGAVVAGNLLFWLLKEKVIIFLQEYFKAHLYQKTIGLPIAYYYGLIRDYVWKSFDNISLINYKFLISLAFILLGYYLVRTYFQNKIGIKKFQFLVLCLIIFNLALVHCSHGQYLFSLISRQVYLRTPQTAEFIKNRENNLYDFRIFSFMVGFSEYNKLTVPYSPQPEDTFIFQAEMIAPNLNAMYGLQSIDSYENMMPRRNARILAELGSDRATLGDKLTDRKISLEEKIEEFLSKIDILSAQNVKYVISAYQFPTDKLDLIATIEATRFKIPLYIYENPNILPRIYFAKQIQFIDTDEIKNFELLMSSDIDSHKTTLIECPFCSQIENAHSEINIKEYKNGLLKLETKTEKSQWLVFGENNLPGWQTVIDGQPADVYTANYIFQAIQVPAGEHSIEFRYRGETKYENLLFD